MSMRRLAGLCSALVFFFGIVLCRVYWISRDTAYAANAGAQTLCSVALPQNRGDFSDRNGRPLTGYTKRWYTLCVPGDSSYARLFPYVSYETQSQLYAMRSAMRPFLVEVDSDLRTQGVYTFESAERYLPLPIAVHLIGYLDGEGNGVTGLEKAYEEVLAFSGSEVVLECSTTAQGRLVAGAAPAAVTLRTGTGLGVRLTLDAAIQRACEGIALQTMERGCIVVMEVGSGDVLASVSLPLYDPNDVAASIAANDTSLINRVFSSFSVGSVFKVAAAAAAYADGLDWFSYECTG
ncbi:MAG: penicillin-binding transpeptidase domain-containing protein, partial [Gemmiger sp.]